MENFCHEKLSSRGHISSRHQLITQGAAHTYRFKLFITYREAWYIHWFRNKDWSTCSWKVRPLAAMWEGRIQYLEIPQGRAVCFDDGWNGILSMIGTRLHHRAGIVKNNQVNWGSWREREGTNPVSQHWNNPMTKIEKLSILTCSTGLIPVYFFMPKAQSQDVHFPS